MLRLAKYSSTPVEFFMGMQAQELGDWFMIAIDEVKREQKAVEDIKKAQANKRTK